MLPNCTDDKPPVQVNISLSLINILDVDERVQILKSSMWVRWHWKDCRLQWDPKQYDDVTVIHLGRERVWIPDITLYDSASVMDFLDVIQYQRPVIKYTGHLVFGFPSIISSTCYINILNFPYDLQRCRLKFSSWSYDNKFLDVSNSSPTGDLSAYVANNEWSLEGFTVERSSVNYTTSSFPDVTFFVEIRRHPLHIYINLLLPCIVISLIGVFMFLLPPESGERISLGITSLLSMVVFSMNIASSLPATNATVPHITKYFSCSIILVACSAVCTILIMRLHHTSDSIRLPRWVKRVIIECIGSVILLGQSCQYQKV
ncbi:hypothetical protein CAPTEDRAFT_89098 [Capitella teleta]|uniref:Neurotransmitter-gated ion-channel ligand-binding domain-containing protein n=1 Tax=Capitella teleta TaxID=283909 RepID=X2BAQ3_CAPTE|nr:hypothetical protein CAPTEDRAFT_89098 [Capitella teleta]|eukprot:ELT90100.1 hypothetical protein CAPTEDRAFT_89098 [Capitella teleta]